MHLVRQDAPCALRDNSPHDRCDRLPQDARLIFSRMTFVHAPRFGKQFAFRAA